MIDLPPDLIPYRKTAVFTATSVPAGLLRDHKTRAGVWGVLHVVAGEVTFRTVVGTGTRLLTPGMTQVIEPEALHSVSLSPDARFYVEFWRQGPH